MPSCSGLTRVRQESLQTSQRPGPCPRPPSPPPRQTHTQPRLRTEVGRGYFPQGCSFDCLLKGRRGNVPHSWRTNHSRASRAGCEGARAPPFSVALCYAGIRSVLAPQGTVRRRWGEKPEPCECGKVQEKPFSGCDQGPQEPSQAANDFI